MLKILSQRLGLGNRKCRLFQFSHKTISSSGVLAHGEFEWKDPERAEDVVELIVYNKSGEPSPLRGKIGDNLLYLCKRWDVAMEGACEGSLACTTCHIYIESPDHLDILPPPTETEEDLLDQAPFLRDNSRLGCQIVLTKELRGMKFRVPAITKNFYVDGHKPGH